MMCSRDYCSGGRSGPEKTEPGVTPPEPRQGGGPATQTVAFCMLVVTCEPGSDLGEDCKARPFLFFFVFALFVGHIFTL